MSKARYSIFAARAVFDVENITPAELRVLAALGTYADDEGWCFPKQATLAERLGLTRQTISGAIKKLVEKGYVETEVRTSKGRGKVGYNYRVVLDVKRQSLVDQADANKPEVGETRHRPDPTSAPADFGADNTPTSAKPDIGIDIDSTNPSERTQDSCGKFVLEPEPASKPKRARKRVAYTPEFEAFWQSWPKARRELSDKRKAFERWSQAEWDAPTLMGAAKHYLSRPNVAKEQHRYCVLAEVFLNGKLDAAVEAYLENGKSSGDETSESEKRRYWELTGRWREQWGPPPAQR